MRWYDYIVLIVSVLMVVVMLLQKSQDSISDAFSGEKSDLFKNKKARGFEKVLDISMLVLSVLFVGLIILSRALIK